MSHQAPQYPYPVQKKSWFARHKFLTAILIFFIAMIVITAMGGEDGDFEPRSSSTTSSNTGNNSNDSDDTAVVDNADEAEPAAEEETTEEAAEPEETEEAAPETPGVGDVVNNDGFDITVTSVESGLSSIQGKYGSRDASGQYVVVHISATNVDNEAHTFRAGAHVLVDEQNRQHSDSDDTIYMGDDAIVYEDVNPGMTLEGYLLYDIPADATPDAILLGSSNIFGGDTVTVSLQ